MCTGARPGCAGWAQPAWGASGTDAAGGEAQEGRWQKSGVQSVGKMGNPGQAGDRVGEQWRKGLRCVGGVPPSQPHPQESCAKINQAEAGSANLGSLTLSSLPLFGQFGT